MNAYERRKAERERAAQARHTREREDKDIHRAKIIEAYQDAYRAVYGITPKLKYDAGWYRGVVADRPWREAEILRMTGKLRVTKDIRDRESEYEHPEYITEDN